VFTQFVDRLKIVQPDQSSMRNLIATMETSLHEPSMNIAFVVRGLMIWGPSRKPFNILKTFCKLFELPGKKKRAR
jgi:hypothetical protein